ncbi:MAG: PIN domain-containing protein [Pseudomonadota bacterium]
MSGTKFLLDTNVIIGLLKGHAASIALAEEAGLILGKAAVSQITRIELLGYPRLTVDEERDIRDFLNACEVCLLDESVEAETIRLRKIGVFKLPDAIIAATAIAKVMHLLTLDREISRKLQELGHGG